MSLKIRLQRHGAKGAPVFRVVVCEHTMRRDGRFVEILGTFHPSPRGQDLKHPLTLRLDRVEHWMKVGAKPSDTVRTLIKQARKGGVAVAEPAKAPAAVAPATTPPVETAPAPVAT
jgi:small subunit ribosomal protein S16